jgi:hypothetical protein
MNFKQAVMPLSLLACIAVASVGFSADKTGTQSMGKAYSKTMKPTMERQWVTFDIRGAESPEAARLLTSTLEAQGLHASIRESKGKPYRLTVNIDRSFDLGALGKAVMAANTPQKAQVAPSLDLVLYAPLTNASAQKATQRLDSIQGVDAKNSHADVSKGELQVRIAGGPHVTADDIHKAVREDGINVRFNKESMGRKQLLGRHNS